MIARLTIIVAIAAGAWFGWAWLFPSDERQIRAVLERIAEGVSAMDDEQGSGLDAMARLAALQDEFAPTATIDAAPPFDRVNGRQALIAAALRVRGATGQLEIEFADVTIDVAADRQTATAAVTAEAQFDAPDGGRTLDARELAMTFTRLDDRWVIATVVLMETLGRPR